MISRGADGSVIILPWLLGYNSIQASVGFDTLTVIGFHKSWDSCQWPGPGNLCVLLSTSPRGIECSWATNLML